MSRTSFRVAGAFLALSSFSLPLMAAEGTSGPPLPSLVLRTGEHPAFDRIVFDAPKGMTYTLSRQDNALLISFSSPAKLALPKVKLTRATGFQIVQGSDGTAPLVVRFAIAPQSTQKDFMSGSSIVIDVFGGPAPQTALPMAPLAAPPTKSVVAAAPTPPAEEKKTVVAISPTPLPPAPQPVPSSSPTPPEDRLAPASVETPPPPHDAVAPTPQAAPVTPIATQETSLPQEAPSFVSPVIKIDPNILAQIQDILNEKEPRPVAVFDPKVPVGAAVFVRGGYITILFDRKLGGDSLLLSPSPRLKLEPVNLPYNTGFRIAVPEGVGVRATRRESAWEVYLTAPNVPPALSTEFVSQPEFALGARLLVPTSAPPKPVIYPDPVVGDDLLVLPLSEPGAFSIKRKLADFIVVPAAQGLVIKPRHEKVMARIVPDGIEITAEGGLKLSPTVDRGLSEEARAGADKAHKPLFDFSGWRGRHGDTFSQTRQRLMQTIIDVKENERILARLDLARFYFAHGNGKESLAILEYIQKQLPEIETHTDFLSLRGACYAWVGRAQEAVADLNHPSLATQPEATLWKAVAASGLHDWTAAFEQFNASWDILADYPEPFRSRFSILAIESAVAVGADDKISPWLSQFEKRGYASSSEPALLYLKAVTYSKVGRADLAEKLWRQVVRGHDRLYKIRAELALVDLGVATKSLTPKQAVDRLEGLRYAWRGDDLELDILTRLGWFYMDAKNFRMGFQVLSQALRLFPNAPPTAALRVEMVRKFRDLFMTDLGKALSPIDSLSLFTDYKVLLPAGEEGNDVRMNLAERLIDIDLLDPASKLLKDIIKNASKPEDRVKVATRLAAVSLLDRKANEALLQLDQSEEEAKTMPEAVQNERRLLRVRSLSELGKYEDALKMFPAQNTKAAMLLRADIAMRAKNWPDASKALMDLIGPPIADKPLDEERAAWLVNAALALTQAGDTAGLDRLAIEYGAAMDKTSRANLFRVLTQPEKVSQMKDLRTAQSKLGEVDMFRGVLDSYRTVPKP